MTSAGRSNAEAASDCAEPQVWISKIVFPGCGGAATMSPYDASSGVKNVDWYAYPHEPCENIRSGYGPPELSSGASTTPLSFVSTGPAPAVVGYQTMVSSTRSVPGDATESLTMCTVRTPT